MIFGWGMRMTHYSLDTNIVLWLLSEPQKLTRKVLNIIQNPDSELSLSVVTFWELQIKSQLGKLSLPYNLEEMQTELIAQFNVTIHPIRVEYVYQLKNLPLIHRDPFDRMIIAQTIYHHYILIGADSIFSSYPVQVIGS